MRYTSSHPHAFRNRIAKSIGVLVAAALIATLGLPSAAQAQEIGAITYSDMTGFMGRIGRLAMPSTPTATQSKMTPNLPEIDKLDRDVKFTRPRTKDSDVRPVSRRRRSRPRWTVRRAECPARSISLALVRTWESGGLRWDACFAITDDSDTPDKIPGSCPSDGKSSNRLRGIHARNALGSDELCRQRRSGWGRAHLEGHEVRPCHHGV